MFQSTSLKSLSPAQRLAAIIVAVVLLFIVVGSLLGPSSQSDQFRFGIQNQSFLVLAFLAFAGGLLSFVSPCTLPILPAYFAFAFQSGRQQIAANTLSFMLGLGVMYSFLGAGASAIGTLLNQSADLLLLLGGSFIVIFGLMSLMGKGFSGFVQENSASNDSLGGSFVFGLTFAVGWTSCTGPILGAVLSLAAVSGTVWHGMMLLFIYTLGLGVPLLIVSTLFGRASRQSLFWRILRGKGWTVSVPRVAVGAVWALVIWRILVAVGNFALSEFHTLAARPLEPWQTASLLGIAVLGVVLWIVTGRERGPMTLHLHSTQLISGALFIALGLLMISGILAYFNSLIPPDLAVWFAGFEEWLIGLFN